MRVLDLRRLLTATAALALCAGPLFADSLTVNTTADLHATTPATSPFAGGSNITLRSALEYVDLRVGPHTITVPAGT